MYIQYCIAINVQTNTTNKSKQTQTDSLTRQSVHCSSYCCYSYEKCTSGTVHVQCVVQWYCPVGRCRVTGNLYLPMSLSRPHPPIACRMHTSTCTHLHFTRLHTHLHDKVVVYIQFSVSVHSRGCSCYSGLHYTLTIVRNVKAQSVRTVYIQCTTTTAEIKYKKTLPANLEKYVIVQ